jgi:tetratricopeptide (TPR) repeat protein
VLVLLALAVILWLPSVLEPSDIAREPEAASAGGEPEAAQAGTAGAGTEARNRAGQATAEDQGPPAAKPFAEAQAARQRREAQDILNELLDVRERLVARGAEQWASDALASIAEQATAGDALYREREFEQAITTYQQALEYSRELEASIPEQLQQQLEQARAALESGEAQAAADALALAGLLAPDNAELAALSRRLEALPQVLAALEQATQAESQGELPAAVEAAQRAVAADGEHQRAAAELSRLQTALVRAQFTAAMSAGYQALDEERFAAAREAFRRAGKLRSDSAEVRTALLEVDSAETAYTLRQLDARAARAVAAEDWSEAVARYEEAIAIDSSVLFAQRGLQQARPRAELDTGLQRLLSEPLRLADENVAQAARRALQLAQGIEAPGPRLQQQIAELSQLIEQASTPITVSLRSDGQTEVTLLRVARLGQFEQRSMELRPGEYTALGTRRGYRDVRISFVVSHEQEPAPVTIACTEAI